MHGQLGPNPGNGVQQLEHLLFHGLEKAKEVEGVLAHHRLDVEKNLLPNPRQSCLPALGKENLVSHPAHIDDEGFGQFFKQHSSQAGNHDTLVKKKKVTGPSHRIKQFPKNNRCNRSFFAITTIILGSIMEEFWQEEKQKACARAIYQ
jgi:hypothetical protein